MIDRMKYRLLATWIPALLVLLAVLSAPLRVLAQEENSKVYDARLEGYENKYTLDAGSTGLTWLLLVVLGAICIGVLFKSGKRTHLD